MTSQADEFQVHRSARGFRWAVVAMDDDDGHWYGTREREPGEAAFPGTVALFWNPSEAEEYRDYMNDQHAETLS